MKRQLVHVVLIAVVLLASSRAHAIMIDTFATPQGAVIGDGQSSTLLAPLGAIGNRTITALVSTGRPQDIVAEVTTILGDTVFTYSQRAGSQGLATVVWDGFSIDLSQPGLAVVVEIIEVDQGEAYLEFRFEDNEGFAKEERIELPQRHFMPAAPALALRVPFTDFIGDANLAHIEEITMTIDGTSVYSLDAQVGLVAAQTPEPGTLLLLGTGLVSLLGYGRWRTKPPTAV